MPITYSAGSATINNNAATMSVATGGLTEFNSSSTARRIGKSLKIGSIEPIRLTPTWEQFQAIVADNLRNQKFTCLTAPSSVSEFERSLKGNSLRVLHLPVQLQDRRFPIETYRRSHEKTLE